MSTDAPMGEQQSADDDEGEDRQQRFVIEIDKPSVYDELRPDTGDEPRPEHQFAEHQQAKLQRLGIDHGG